MQKVVKSFFIGLVAMVTSLGLLSCSKDDKSETVSLKGKWYSISESLNEFMIIKEDNSVQCYRKDKDGQQLWENIPGKIVTVGNNITMNFEDGNNASGTFVLEENKLVIITSYGSYTYTRLSDYYNIEGEWTTYSVVSDMVAIKDEIELPSGTMNDGTEIPATLKTSQLSGQFMDFAIGQYLRNIKFNGNKLSYKVLKGDKEITMSKEFVLGDIDITLKGNVAGHPIETKMMMVQTADEEVIAITLTKNELANMFAAYAVMLAEGGLAPQPDAAAIEAFKQSFVDAFVFYNVTLRLRRL